MPRQTESIHRSQTSNGQFLYAKTETVHETQETGLDKIISLDRLKEKFPRVLIETDFISTAMDQLEDVDQFSAMVVRIDDILFVLDPEEVIFDVTTKIDEICNFIKLTLFSI